MVSLYHKRFSFFVFCEQNGVHFISSVFLDKNYKYNTQSSYPTDPKIIKKAKLDIDAIEVIYTEKDGVIELQPTSSIESLKYKVHFEDGSFYSSITSQFAHLQAKDQESATVILLFDRIIGLKIDIPISIKEHYIIDRGIKYNNHGTLLSCNSLEKDVVISNNATIIDRSAFKNCIHLETITIPKSVTIINTYAFGNCDSLKTLTIPSSVTSMEKYIFSHCDALSTIYCEAESKPAGWDDEWLGNCTATVVWGYTGE